MTIKDKSWVEDLVADHLSRLVETKDDIKPIEETFSYEHLYSLEGRNDIEHWYADIVNYLVIRELPHNINLYYKSKLKFENRFYMWDHPYLWKIGQDQVI